MKFQEANSQSFQYMKREYNMNDKNPETGIGIQTEDQRSKAPRQ